MPDLARSTEQPPPLWQAARDDAMSAVEANAGADFTDRACVFVLDYLTAHGPTSGEVITDACKAAGIVPHDDRAFGPVYMRLVRSGRIAHHSYARRTKGHGTGGANVWQVNTHARK